MKNEVQIKEQLKDIYEHRLGLRISRKMKRSCRNCIYGKETTFNLGEFGDITKYACSLSLDFNNDCKFECKNNKDGIEKEMIEDIKDPSVCGAKEPKIAALLWVLHEGKSSKGENKEDSLNNITNIFSKLKRLF